MNVSEEPLWPEDLQGAREVFITNAVRGIRPVARIGETRGVALTGLTASAISVDGLKQANETWLPGYMAAGPE